MVEPADLIGIGDHPALDFLNSTAVPVRERVELIGDGRAYLDWLERAGFIDAADAAVLRGFSPAELDAAAAAAVQLREWLRPVITAWATADAPALPPSACDRLNQVLAAGRRFLRLGTDDDGGIRVSEQRSWDGPGQLLVPPAEAAARLLAEGEPRLVRRCEGPGCTLWFYDRTKSHRRRWCSMAACGNREKARKHRTQASTSLRESP